jgi:hypothetical protein
MQTHSNSAPLTFRLSSLSRFKVIKFAQRLMSLDRLSQIRHSIEISPPYCLLDFKRKAKWSSMEWNGWGNSRHAPLIPNQFLLLELVEKRAPLSMLWNAWCLLRLIASKIFINTKSLKNPLSPSPSPSPLSSCSYSSAASCLLTFYRPLNQQYEDR